MNLFKHPEGPPSETDLRLLVADLLFWSRISEAHELAARVVDNLLDRPATQREPDHCVQFYYWLGVKSATAHILAGRRAKSERQPTKKYERPQGREPQPKKASGR